MAKLPRWADLALVPLISLVLAALVSAIVLVLIGQSPMQALSVMVDGALGSASGWGYTLYYATSFIFTGLGVTIAFHAGLFNIGGEGQAQLGGLGVALACLFLPWPHWTVALVGASLAAALFGAAWAAIPAWLQAKRGSHIVITTIMFNYIAAALLIYILGEILRPVGSMDPASARFPAELGLPHFHEMPILRDFFLKYGPDGAVKLSAQGLPVYSRVPANITFFLSLIAAFGVWVLLWHTRLGYEMRAFGKQEKAARYAGISAFKIIMVAMLLSGALSGLMAINNVMGQAERLLQNSAEGAGFIGIAVALMGRNHPLGVVLAAVLFGFLYQGGAALGLNTSIPIELRTVVQGLVILFTGALDYMVRIMLTWVFSLRQTERAA
ncbi:ABC transporter permease [Fuscibacter oryzae]|uniref:ABC transporter permease n=1 Tax=Fuscibacter oryzae TaxID=2803939 RepID=A0A8J7MNE6_9RHOB|nr:ABC transporter permease [Fuscibacter oryzae]MBL4926913.1 ABC transporter permease [Fuscibacter oryzae]